MHLLAGCKVQEGPSGPYVRYCASGSNTEPGIQLAPHVCAASTPLRSPLNDKYTVFQVKLQTLLFQ